MDKLQYSESMHFRKIDFILNKFLHCVLQTGLDKSVLQAFIQLRTDYKTSKIATMLK